MATVSTRRQCRNERKHISPGLGNRYTSLPRASGINNLMLNKGIAPSFTGEVSCYG